MAEKRRTYTPRQKANMVLETLNSSKPLNEIAQKHSVNPVLLSRWRTEFMQKAERVFDKQVDDFEKIKQTHQKEKDELLKQIGRLTYENSRLSDIKTD